jgi:hypothetical protein
VGEGVVVRPDQVSLGMLVSAVPRDAVDEAVVGQRHHPGLGNANFLGFRPEEIMVVLREGHR